MSFSISSPRTRERLEWIRYYERVGNARQICLFFGIPPKTFYKWLKRYQEQGISGLSDQTRRPKRVREPEIPIEWVAKAVEVAQSNPFASKYRVSEILESEFGIRLSASSVWRILKRYQIQRNLDPVAVEFRPPAARVAKTRFLTAKRRLRLALRRRIVREKTQGALIFARAGLAFALVASPVVNLPQQSPVESLESRAIRVELNSQNPVALAQVESPKIQVTESEFEKNQREEAERQRKEQVKRAIAARPKTAPKRSGCPGSFRSVYEQAGAAFGVPWQILEAIHQVESGKSCHTDRSSSAGATGPMQFLPSTFTRYATDGDGDGVADITNAYDAIYSGARHIGTGLHGGSMRSALLSYNRAQWYVDKVIGIARELGYSP
jgi:transposase